MGIAEVVRAARSPCQNAYVERVIGSIRRECVDHVVIFNERHLRRVLSTYIDYYNQTRTHLSLDNIARNRTRSCHSGSEESSPSHKSVACITVTNVSPPDSSLIFACQLLHGCLYASSAGRSIRACSISRTAH